MISSCILIHWSMSCGPISLTGFQIITATVISIRASRRITWLRRIISWSRLQLIPLRMQNNFPFSIDLLSYIMFYATAELTKFYLIP